MAGPEWARWAFALLFAVVGLCFLYRLVVANESAGRARWSLDAHHVLMAGGMTAMFLPIGNIGPQQIWAALFVADAGWVGLQLMRRAADASHLVNHLLASVAMVYMFIAMLNHTGSGVGHQIALAQLGWLLAAYFLGYTVWAGLRLAGPDMASIIRGGGRIGGSLQLVMGVGMSYMLLTAL